MDSIIGKWKGDISGQAGLKDFMETLGHPEVLDVSSLEFILEVTSPDNHKLALHNDISGQIHETSFEPGKKILDFFSGIGWIEVDSVQEGNKFANKTTYQGKPLERCMYTEGDTLVFDCTYGDVKTKTFAYRA